MSCPRLFIILLCCVLTLHIQAAQDLACPIPGGKAKYVAPDSLCTSYYICNGEIATKIPCPAGSLFDNDKEECILASEVKCKDV
ncbi:predicted protein [Lichtheimia corymbifera JMRC:FSU:9682]|uniref:Chitin-binding type-2 domain-containing protein n=1 Tax=Lichtheimia corymbifera JMRC:FSU:9682 TaxID=1263082 RepID=A0A068RXC1_9FUNG|nr:predicted protein [Lichtheimia corymbifera JMRC:FSU:9682]